MRPLAAFLVLGLSGCLPPPRAWLQMSPEGPPPPGADDSAASTEETGLVPDDTGAPELQCYSLTFASNGHVEITSSTVADDRLFDEGSLTVEMWAQFTEQTESGQWLLAGMDGNQSWNLGVEDGQLVLEAGGIYTLAIPLPAHGWRHIAGVIDGDGEQMSLYVDGAFSGSRQWYAPMVSDGDNPSIHLGGFAGTETAWPNLMDEVRLATDVMYSGPGSIDYADERPVSDWLAVFRFDESLENAVSGALAQGENIRYVDTCP